MSKSSSAESNFMSRLMGEMPMQKEAVDLDPMSLDTLGIQTVSPAMLDQLENQAGSMPADAPSPARPPADENDEEPAPQETEPAETVDVNGFDRTDAPPELEEGEEAAPEPDLPNRATHGRLFTDKRAHPIKLLEVLTQRYDTAWTEWEPDTLWWSIRRDFGPVGNVVRNKIGALRVAAITDTPWLDWDVFEDSGLAWNDVVPIVGAFQPMTPAQTAFAVTTLRAIRPDEEFNGEVTAYIAAILSDNGWVYAPPEYFGKAQELLDRRVWLVGFHEEVAKAWEALKNVDPMTIDWNQDHPLDVHLLRLMVVKHYVDERAAMQNQVLGTVSTTSTVQPPVP